MEEAGEHMALIDSEMKQCVIIDKKSVSDGEGGFTTQYVESDVVISAAIALDQSTEMLVGQSQNAVPNYTVLTHRNAALPYFTIIKRLEDGLYLRVTSNGSEKKTPTIAGLQLSKVTAERWVMPID